MLIELMRPLKHRQDHQSIYFRFGVVCHNGEWYVSKYPTGVGYRNKDSVYNYIGTNGELDGKKAKIEEFAW